jgi:microcystin-dependent protein
LGTTYGGNGTTTFGLPNYQGRDVLSQGTGPGLSTYVLGQAGGVETNTVLPTNMPVHAHPTLGSGGDAPTQNTASGASLATGGRSDMPNIYSAGNANPTPMGSMTGIAGSGQPMPNMQPYLVLNYIICLFGVFPARN